MHSSSDIGIIRLLAAPFVVFTSALRACVTAPERLLDAPGPPRGSRRQRMAEWALRNHQTQLTSTTGAGFRGRKAITDTPWAFSPCAPTAIIANQWHRPPIRSHDRSVQPAEQSAQEPDDSAEDNSYGCADREPGQRAEHCPPHAFLLKSEGASCYSSADRENAHPDRRTINVLAKILFKAAVHPTNLVLDVIQSGIFYSLDRGATGRGKRSHWLRVPVGAPLRTAFSESLAVTGQVFDKPPPETSRSAIPARESAGRTNADPRPGVQS